MSKYIAILGGGESGVGAALLAKAKGIKVFLSDQGKLAEKYRQQLMEEEIEFEEGSHTEERILSADEVIKSPGIPDKAPIIKALHTKNIPVIGEIEFAARYTNARLIAITGSNGKTTTTLLTYHLLKNAGLNVGLAGNIGDSFAKQVITDSYDYYVLEISSFMLDTMFSFKANIAILSNITPDHLDRYQYSFQNYIDSKFRILQNMKPTDTFIYWKESEAIANEITRRGGNDRLIPHQLPISIEKRVSEGGWMEEGKLEAIVGSDLFTIDLADLPIAGTHNALNALCAILVAMTLRIPSHTIREGLLSFRNAPHRLEPVGEIDGIRFVNDSKATNVDSVYYALGSFQQPLILIIGGVDKGNEYGQIEELVIDKVKLLICLGVDNAKLKTYFATKVPAILETQSIQQAVEWGRKYGEPGDVVLLSPACASFDLFTNYEDRGNQFRAAVRALEA
ncbi:MAG: UDP-N-acetylmuramoyl-L-alanine--D-glutamate ligase [Siphonobacter sp.]